MEPILIALLAAVAVFLMKSRRGSPGEEEVSSVLINDLDYS